MKVKISLVVVLATLVAATMAFGQGYNFVSWPLLVSDTNIQAVFADSMGQGCQLTGGYPAGNSDRVQYFNAADSNFYSAWYKVGGPGPQKVWQGDLTTVEADKGYWVIIEVGHSAVTLTMTGSVNTSTRNIYIHPGASYNYVGTAFATVCSIDGSTGDDANLLGSGFTGGYPAENSDRLRSFDGTNYYTAWRKVGGPGPQNIWQGDLYALEPGNGYFMQLPSGHAFIANTWVYGPPPAYKGGKVVSSRKVRAAQPIRLSKDSPRAIGARTNMRLFPEKEADQKRDR